MPEPTERFTFAKTKTTSQIEVVDGKPYCFIDIGFPEDMELCGDVCIGWAPDGSRFGVYLNGHQLWPPDTDNDDTITNEE